MNVLQQQIPLDCVIYDTGDYHFGALNCHKELLREMVDEIQQKNRTRKKAFLINKGDNCDSISPDDKRYNHLSVDWQQKLLTPQAQADAVIDLLEPIAGNVIAIGEGNHEWKFINTFRVGTHIAKALGCPFGGYVYIVQFLGPNGKQLFKTFHHHGSGKLPKGAKDPIQRAANRQAHLRRKLEATGISDCIYMSMGHTHQLVVVEPTIDHEVLLTTTPAGRLKQHTRPPANQNAVYIPPEKRWYANTGSFLRLYSPPGSDVFGYAEVAMLEPTRLGWVEIEVQGGVIVEVRKREHGA